LGNVPLAQQANKPKCHFVSGSAYGLVHFVAASR